MTDGTIQAGLENRIARRREQIIFGEYGGEAQKAKHTGQTVRLYHNLRTSNTVNMNVLCINIWKLQSAV